MMRFANPGNIKTTAFYHWLWVAWCNRSEYKMEWLLNYFATKLQQPDRKIKKFLIAFSRLCGTGKTSVRIFCECIFGVDKTLFVETVDDFMRDETSEMLNKMFCIVDDIERANRKTSDSLKSKVTSHTFQYKKLYKDRITLPSYIDLIATSNAREPVFIGSDNRRTELVEINPELKPDIAFWDRWYAEAKDSKICGMWFHHLANMPITMDVRSHKVKFDKEAVQHHKRESMKLCHRFLVEFFENPECFEAACKQPRYDTGWFSKIRFIEGDVPAVFIERQRFFDYFQWWRKATDQRLSAKMQTFIKDLEEIGMKRTRRTVDTHKLTGFDVREHDVAKGISDFYNFEPILKLAWCWPAEEDFTKYKPRRFMFRDDF